MPNRILVPAHRFQNIIIPAPPWKGLHYLLLSHANLECKFIPIDLQERDEVVVWGDVIAVHLELDGILDLRTEVGITVVENCLGALKVERGML